MSLLFITDLHLDNYKPFSQVLANGMNSRLLDQLKVVQQVSTTIEKHKPEAVFFLGDLFNGITDSLPKIIYNAGFLTAQSWSKNTQLYLVVGNHDIYRGMHVFSTFETLPNIHIIARTTKINLGGYEIDLVPWENPLPKERGDICAGHLEVYGAMMDAAFQCKGGINPTAFFGYQYVLLGHFHNPQSIKVEGAKTAQYIGAIMQTDRRRTSEGFMGVTLLGDDGILSYIPVDSPRIYTVALNTEEDADSFLEKYDPNHYYRVSITNQEIEIPVNSHISVEYDLPEVATTRLNLPSKPGDKSTVIENVLTWIDNANTILDKDELKELAKELLK